MEKIPKNPIIIGKICKNYKYNKLFKLFSFTKKKKNIFKYKPLYIKNKNWKIISFKNYIKKKNFFIIKIKNIKKNQTKLFNNENIYFDFKKLKIIKNINYYYKDIIECIVINFDNYKLGKIKKIMETKLNNIIIIKKKKEEILIPFIINKIIKKIDIKLKIIKIKWIFNL
ncbi:ribosome maturation factor RimM [Enterobacteriaceae bacterium ET-AT1-13]|nr:ribosome maturation factor RimM [Enterobacteriaceae bacterium ET-AT1-13]WGS66512.1 ribosome maturation factor RimM [Enterobacteriaceae bacterium Cmel17]WMC17536.1 MAG: ribosome maturation factor RimM [Enterobacteriaceae bacterium Cmel21]WMC17743.1 MAG: ribosome maturation factor RimM [Enterobacteriaceae bacterium PSmelAO3-2]WMC17947.1 MAG: ribosome maturation factor RimM [Enterobacteriaceae bacterium PSmelAO3-1]WMC18149.1 MAG: ribosome maturation factor RimM [Enterobacteriaceae bacterium PS